MKYMFLQMRTAHDLPHRTQQFGLKKGHKGSPSYSRALDAQTFLRVQFQLYFHATIVLGADIPTHVSNHNGNIMKYLFIIAGATLFRWLVGPLSGLSHIFSYIIGFIPMYSWVITPLSNQLPEWSSSHWVSRLTARCGNHQPRLVESLNHHPRPSEVGSLDTCTKCLFETTRNWNALKHWNYMK